jgi:hypothetical protein
MCQQKVPLYICTGQKLDMETPVEKHYGISNDNCDELESR